MPSAVAAHIKDVEDLVLNVVTQFEQYVKPFTMKWRVAKEDVCTEGKGENLNY